MFNYSPNNEPWRLWINGLVDMFFGGGCSYSQPTLCCSLPVFSQLKYKHGLISVAGPSGNHQWNWISIWSRSTTWKIIHTTLNQLVTDPRFPALIVPPTTTCGRKHEGFSCWNQPGGGSHGCHFKSSLATPHGWMPSNRWSIASEVSTTNPWPPEVMTKPCYEDA